MDCCIFINQALKQIAPQNMFVWVKAMILNVAENGKHTGMILINLQKAFDTLDHTISFDKMKCIGFSDKTER